MALTLKQESETAPQPRSGVAGKARAMTIRAEMRRDDEGWYALSCPSLPAHTCVKDKSEAKMMLVDAVAGFFEGCERAGVLREVFAEHGYNLDENSGRYPAIQLDFNGEMLYIAPAPITPPTSSPTPLPRV